MAKRKARPDEDIVTLSTLKELLDDQREFMTNLMAQQEKTLKSCMEQHEKRMRKYIDAKIAQLKTEIVHSKDKGGFVERAVQSGRRSEDNRSAKKRTSGFDINDECGRYAYDDVWYLKVTSMYGGRTMQVKKDTTVDDLYDWVNKTIGCPRKGPKRIFYGNTILEYGHGKLLSDYKIQNHSTIDVFERIVAGLPCNCKVCG